MVNPYAPLPPGAPVTAISRTAYNELLRMLRWWQTSSTTGQRPHTQHDGTKIFVKNGTASTVGAFGILGLGAPLVLPSTNAFAAHQQPAFAGETPDPDDHANKWAALIEPAAAGALARAILVGHAVVRVYVTATTDEFCAVSAAKTVSGETVYLATGPAGVPILWLDSGTSAAAIGYAIVLMGAGGVSYGLYGKMDESLTGTGTATMSVWDGDWTHDTGDNIEVYLPPWATAATIDSASWVHAIQRGDGAWVLDGAPC
jgi:hypothetical protein